MIELADDTDERKVEPVSDGRFKLNRTMTVGDVAVILSFICSAFAVYNSFDKRVEKVEYTQATLESRTKESILDLKVDIKELQGTMNSVQRELARIPSQNNSPTVIQMPAPRRAQKGD